MILSTSNTTRTATEVNELKEEKMVLLSPLLEQIHSALRQILYWIYDEEIKIGLIKKPNLKSYQFKIEFVSSLAQAQKVTNISSMERFTTFVSNIANSIDPILKSKLNAEKIIEDYAHYANINPEQIVSKEEMDEIRKNIQENEKKQNELETIKQGSQILQNMGGVDLSQNDLLERFGVI